MSCRTGFLLSRQKKQKRLWGELAAALPYGEGNLPTPLRNAPTKVAAGTTFVGEWISPPVMSLPHLAGGRPPIGGGGIHPFRFGMHKCIPYDSTSSEFCFAKPTFPSRGRLSKKSFVLYYNITEVGKPLLNHAPRAWFSLCKKEEPEIRLF